MSEFLYQTNRMDNSLDELVDLTQEQKTEHIFKVMCEWPSTRLQLRLENIYDPKSGVNLGDKFWTNQQFSALKVYNNLDAMTEDILKGKERWMYFQRKHPPYSQSFLPIA